MDIEIHEYQISILRELLFKPKARFRDIKKVEEGENIWMSEKEYRALKNVFAGIDEVKEQLNNKGLQYIDKVVEVGEY